MSDSPMFSFLLGQAKNLNGSLSKKALALVEALEGKVRSSLMDRFSFLQLLTYCLICWKKWSTAFYCSAISAPLLLCLTMLIVSKSFSWCQ